MLKFSCAGYLGLPPVISAQFILEINYGSQPEIAKKSLNPLFLGFKLVQGHPGADPGGDGGMHPPTGRPEQIFCRC